MWEKSDAILREIQNILAVHDQGHLPCKDVKQNLQKKVRQINEQIESLQLLRSELQGLLLDWQDQPPEAIAARTICPNLETGVERSNYLCEQTEIRA